MDDQNPPPVIAQSAPTRRNGRPEYKPTDAERARVRELRAERKTAVEIAADLKISRNTLRKHFAQDLAKVAAAAEPQGLELVGTHEPQLEAAAPIGRPEYEPTYRQREDVRLWKADDWSDDRIARRLGISRNTLLKHFAHELEDGADHVRATALRNLLRASNAGNVGASNALLRLSGLVPPPPAPPPGAGEGEGAPVEEPLGKKALAKRTAFTAEEGTSWSELMN